MKKRWYLLVLCMMLTGCNGTETFETLGKIQHDQIEIPAIASVALSLPECAVMETFGGEDKVFDCGEYTLVLQNLQSGDFQTTVERISGFDAERLTIMQSGSADIKRWDWIWTAASDEGELLGRAAVLDDGNYHYCLYILAPAQIATVMYEEWNGIFASFHLGA